MKQNSNNTQNEKHNRNRVINAIKNGTHEENALCIAAGMREEYPDFCMALWQLQREGTIIYIDGEYYMNDPETVAHEAANADRIEKERNEAKAPAVELIDECTTRYNNVTAARIIESVLNIAETVGLTYGSSYPAHDAKIDIIRFAKWMDGESSDGINPAWPFFFAIRKQGSESGTREHCKSRCAVLGSPVYVIKVERKAADLFALSIRVAGHKVAAEVFAAATAAEDAKGATQSDQDGDEITAYIVTRHGDAVRYFFISENKAEAEREAERMNDSDPHNTYNVETCTTTRADLAKA